MTSKPTRAGAEKVSGYYSFFNANAVLFFNADLTGIMIHKKPVRKIIPIVTLKEMKGMSGSLENKEGRMTANPVIEPITIPVTKINKCSATSRRVMKLFGKPIAR